MHVQAPPNLSDEFADLLDAGIDDWGGVSPVTADHVNPERPWPALDRLREVTERRGFNLAPRLTIYPEFAGRPEQWLDANLRFLVLDRSDAESLGRDDPGAVYPQKVGEYKNVGDGAEVVLVGRRSTQWYSGADVHPPRLLPGSPRAVGRVGEVLDGVRLGQEPGEDELATLFTARGQEVASVAALADELRAEAVGDTVTWVSNRNINYTNVCTFKCRFCGFSKGPLSLNLRGTPYLLTLDDIATRTREAWDRGATEVCLQGGIHPDFDGDYYMHVARTVRDAGAGHPYPRLHGAGGDRGRPPPRRTAAALSPEVDGRRSAFAARYGGGNPGRRHPGHHLPRQDHDRRMAGGAPHRPRGGVAVEHHHHVRFGGAARPLGAPHRPHPRSSKRRRAGSRSSWDCPSCIWRPRFTCSVRLAGGRRGEKWC